MNPVFQAAVEHVSRTCSNDHQQVIGEAILDGAALPERLLPVIEFGAECSDEQVLDV